jgi:hypothetical protein
MTKPNIKLEYLKSDFLQKVTIYSNILKNAIEVPEFKRLSEISTDFDKLSDAFKNISYINNDIKPLKALLEILFDAFASLTKLLSEMQVIKSVLFTENNMRKIKSNMSVTTAETANLSSIGAHKMIDNLNDELFILKHYYWPILIEDINKSQLNKNEIIELLMDIYAKYPVSDIMAYLLNQLGVEHNKIYEILNMDINTVPIMKINIGTDVRFNIYSMIDVEIATLLGINKISNTNGVSAKTIQKFTTLVRENIKYSPIISDSEISRHIAIGQIMNNEIIVKMNKSDALPVTPAALINQTEIANKNERIIRKQQEDIQIRKLRNLTNRKPNDNMLATLFELNDMYDLMRLSELQKAEETSLRKNDPREKVHRYIAGNKYFTRAGKMPHQVLIDLL